MIFYRLTKVPVDGFWLKSEELVKGLLPGVQLDVYYPGFPTLKHLKYKVSTYMEIKIPPNFNAPKLFQIGVVLATERIRRHNGEIFWSSIKQMYVVSNYLNEVILMITHNMPLKMKQDKPG